MTNHSPDVKLCKIHIVQLLLYWQSRYTVVNCALFSNSAQNLELLHEIWSILRLECAKFNFGWGAYSAPPGLVAGFKGPTTNEKEGVAYRRMQGGGEE